MGLKRKISGSILAVAGFMLSPLSWWNDAIVNLPLALAFAWLVTLPCPKSWKETVFEIAVIVGYWLTNIIGFLLMHKGVKHIISEKDSPTTRREIKKDLIVSLIYTALIVILIKLGVLKPIECYFR